MKIVGEGEYMGKDGLVWGCVERGKGKTKKRENLEADIPDILKVYFKENSLNVCWININSKIYLI